MTMPVECSVFSTYPRYKAEAYGAPGWLTMKTAEGQLPKEAYMVPLVRSITAEARHQTLRDTTVRQHEAPYLVCGLGAPATQASGEQ